jgi:hypothetical protein
MTPLDPNFWIIFFILGVPVILLAGGASWLIMLAILAAVVYAPATTIVLCVLWFGRWLIKDFLIAFVAGLSLRLAGTFNSPERAERMRERWEDRRARRLRRNRGD